jgi:hypothetical protein
LAHRISNGTHQFDRNHSSVIYFHMNLVVQA